MIGDPADAVDVDAGPLSLENLRRQVGERGDRAQHDRDAGRDVEAAVDGGQAALVRPATG